MKKLNNDMSRLMICSNQDLVQCDLPLDLRLRLLRAIRCFHMEKWSKCLMNNFQHTQKNSFEIFIYHLLKYHIWIIHTSWTLNYIRKYLIITNDTHLQLFYEKMVRLKQTIDRLKQMIIVIKKTI